MLMRPLVIVFALLAGAPAPAEPPAAEKDKGKDEAGWKSLFDKKTLAGWKSADYFAAGKVEVKDGALVMEKGKKMTGAVYDRGDFPKMDYEVTFEGKKVAGDDFFCTT